MSQSDSVITVHSSPPSSQRMSTPRKLTVDKVEPAPLTTEHSSETEEESFVELAARDNNINKLAAANGTIQNTEAATVDDDVIAADMDAAVDDNNITNDSGSSMAATKNTKEQSVNSGANVNADDDGLSLTNVTITIDDDDDDDGDNDQVLPATTTTTAAASKKSKSKKKPAAAAKKKAPAKSTKKKAVSKTETKAATPPAATTTTTTTTSPATTTIDTAALDDDVMGATATTTTTAAATTTTTTTTTTSSSTTTTAPVVKYSDPSVRTHARTYPDSWIRQDPESGQRLPLPDVVQTVDRVFGDDDDDDDGGTTRTARTMLETAYGEEPDMAPCKFLPVVFDSESNHFGSVFHCSFSPSLLLMATCDRFGVIRVWHTPDFRLLATFRDEQEPEIMEYYWIVWSPDETKLAASGRLKSRKQWSPDDEDNAILSTPVKVFDARTGVVLANLHGHLEEIWYGKLVPFGGFQFLLTAGEDGKLIKWEMNEQFSNVRPGRAIVFKNLGLSTQDEDVSTVLSFSFLPNCGNRFFVAAADSNLLLYDFETASLIESFPSPYGFISDTVKFIDWTPATASGEQGATAAAAKKKGGRRQLQTGSAPLLDELYLISTGVELVSSVDETKLVRPNSLTLHKLLPANERRSQWSMETVRVFRSKGYHANSWPGRFTVLADYLFAPTDTSSVFVWRISTGDPVARVHAESDRQRLMRTPSSPGRRRQRRKHGSKKANDRSIDEDDIDDDDDGDDDDDESDATVADDEGGGGGGQNRRRRPLDPYPEKDGNVVHDVTIHPKKPYLYFTDGKRVKCLKIE